MDRTRRRRHANSAATDARHGGSALPRPPESAPAFLTQSGHPKPGQGILLRLGSLPTRPRVLTRAGLKGAATPLAEPGRAGLQNPTFSLVKNLIFLKPTTCDRTSTSPCARAAGPAILCSSAISSTRTWVERMAWG